MNLQNPFPQAVRNLYLYVFGCAECGRSDQGLELHHIWGRISGSALNSIPLCKVCHGKVGHSREERQHFLRITMKFLLAIGYKLLPEDNQFLETIKDDLRGFEL